MKGKIEANKKSKVLEKFNSEIDNIIPEDFNIIDLVVKGKRIVSNMKEIMQVSNCENKSELISKMNEYSTHYFYFSRIAVDLQKELSDLEEEFEIWFSIKKGRFPDEGSEKAKERSVLSKYRELYLEKKKKISDVKSFLGYAKIAEKSLDKGISLIQSIGAMIRSEEANTKKNEGFDKRFKEDDE